MLIRRAVLADLERLLPLLQAYRGFYEQRPDPERERAYLLRHLERGTSTIFVAEEHDAIVGFTQLFPAFSTVHLAPSFILEDLYVVERARGSGIADALLESALGFARENAAAGMFLETAHDNVRAQRVYERCGWRREGRFYKYNAPLAGEA